MAGFDFPPDSLVIDVSQAQKPINWQQVKNSGVAGVIVRATQGVPESLPVGVDTAFLQHIEGALAAGLLVGVYHAFIASREGNAQAQLFHSTIEPYLDRLAFPPAIDVELDNGQTPEVISGRLFDMASTLFAMGITPAIYTSVGFWNANVSPRNDDYFGKLPLWVAHWTEAPAPLLPRAWKGGTWALWQFTSSGSIDGVEGRVDVNRTPATEAPKFTLSLPVDSPARITQVYGANYEYYMANFGLPGHEGIDYGGSDGANIYAAADGTVKLIAKDNGVHPYGNQIRLTHADGYESIYAHLRGFKPELAQGDSVKSGQVIGYLGSTGNSTGLHLHFTLKHNGSIIDPTPYLP